MKTYIHKIFFTFSAGLTNFIFSSILIVEEISPSYYKKNSGK